MAFLFLILIRLLRVNTLEIPMIWMFIFLFGLDCRLIFFFWPSVITGDIS